MRLQGQNSRKKGECMERSALRTTIISTVLDRISSEDSRREEALAGVLNLTVPEVDKEIAQDLAALIPALPLSLYEKWAGMFADRLLETVPVEQVEDLCKPGNENRATLILVYLMFMESERMEKQVPEDLKKLVAGLPDPDGAALQLSTWLRHKMTGGAKVN